jgi:hypothetical protein
MKTKMKKKKKKKKSLHRLNLVFIPWQVNYHKGERYFEVDIDIGSSAVANSVVRFVFGYARYIVVDMAYLIQGNSEEELPEQLLGSLRVAHLDLSAAVEPPPADFVESTSYSR